MDGEQRIETSCPHCRQPSMSATLSTASHDSELLNLVLECRTTDGGCGSVFSHIMAIADMQGVK